MMPTRFFTVGVACALLHNAIVISGDWVGLHYAVASLFSFAIVVGVGYRLHSSWTFPQAGRDTRSFAQYVLLASANYPMSLAGMFVLVDRFAVPVRLATPLVTVLLAAWNFFGNRRVFAPASRLGARP
jgi:putative flippase GtrA